MLVRAARLAASRRAFAGPARLATSTQRAFAGPSTRGLVTTTLEGGIATITLDDPSKMNAMTVAMGEAFEASVAELRREPPEALRAVVLTGSGKAFSAGGDLDWLAERHRDAPSNNVAAARGDRVDAAANTAIISGLRRSTS